MFAGIWHITKDTHMPLHDSLKDVYSIPYTISFVIRKRRQIDSFMELPKDKRPPKSLYDKPNELEEWLDRAFSTNKQTEFKLDIDEIEG